MIHLNFSLGDTYKTLFWTLFNYGEPKYAEVVVGNEMSKNEMVKHKMTEGMGYILYGTYNVISVIVLLNMLIAMMAHSYDAIEVSKIHTMPSEASFDVKTHKNEHLIFIFLHKHLTVAVCQNLVLTDNVLF